MWKNPNKPSFGTLDSLKVVHATTNMAGPMAATILADHGADVLWLENPRIPDSSRMGVPMCLEVERRNSRNLALDIPSEKGKEVLKKIIEGADVYMEGAKPGAYDKWGLTDEVLWSWNPKLIIVHVSGYGHSGDPYYYTRGGYDAIGQAASGFMHQNYGTITPFNCDATTAIYTAFAIMAAVYRAKETGVGESIDVSQVEVMMRHQVYLTDYATKGVYFGDERKFNGKIAGWGPFTAADGKDVYVVGMGGNTLKVGAQWLGIPYGTDEVPAGSSLIAKNTPIGDKWDKAVADYVASVPAEQAEREMLEHSIPCTRIMSYEDVVNTDHWWQRGAFTKWESNHGFEITGVNAMPKMERNPGQVWRAAPSLGMDNEEVLKELGYTDEEIAAMYEGGTINKRPVEDFIQ